MRILEIIPGFIKRAGAEVFLSNLVKEFVKNQPNDIYLLCFYDKVDASFYPFVESMKDRIFFAHKKLGLDLSASKRVGKIITKLSPNIIHTHLSSIKTMFIGQPCLISRKKIVHTVHNLVENDTYGLPDLSIKKYLLLRKKLHFVGISDKISESIKDFYGRLSKNSIETIYNGVPLEQRNEHYDKKFDFICPARFVEQKTTRLSRTS